MELCPYLFCLFFFVFYIFSYLLSKTMGCFSGCLMSSAAFRSCFVEFTQRLNVLLINLWERKLSPLLYSSAILGPPPGFDFAGLFSFFFFCVCTSIIDFGFVVTTWVWYNLKQPCVCVSHTYTRLLQVADLVVSNAFQTSCILFLSGLLV